MGAHVVDRIDWSMTRDSDSYRTYDIAWMVESDDHEDSPDVILQASGLPQPNESWAFGTGNDPWALCQWDADVSMHEPDPQSTSVFWIVKQKFTNKPAAREGSGERGNPLLEPYTISGTFQNIARERSLDKDGKPLINSALEPLRGPLVTRNVALATVAIGMNVADVPLGALQYAMNRVNGVSMWGLPPRYARMENAPWSRHVLGTDFVYYTVNYEFLINFESWDEPIVDMGLRVLIEGGDKTNPAHYEAVKNAKEEKESEPVFLDGNGERLTDLSSPVIKTPKIDLEFNFFSFGIPSVL